MNPTLRGFLIIALIAGVIVVLQLYQTLVALSILARIAFLLAVAFFVYLVWRERRGEISEWSARARTAFYGAAILIVVDIGVFTFARSLGARRGRLRPRARALRLRDVAHLAPGTHL